MPVPLAGAPSHPILNALSNEKESPISFRSICLTTLTTFKIIDSLKTGLPQEINIDDQNS
jgi:polar amino acid transport system substrate-binding protein